MSSQNIHTALKKLFGENSDLHNSLKNISSRVTDIAHSIEEDLVVAGAQLSKNNNVNEELVTFAVANGWYPDFSTTTIPKSLELLRNYHEKYKQHGENIANSYMSSHFEMVAKDKLDTIIEKIGTERETIIREAIKAHELGLYTLSSPVFLIQTDGYTRHAYDQGVWGLMGKESIIAKSKKHHEMEKGELFKTILSPLTSEDTPILKSNRNRKKDNSGKHSTIINRHSVIHGESFEYGTRENSMRAFSFFIYCILFIDFFWEDDPAKE